MAPSHRKTQGRRPVSVSRAGADQVVTTSFLLANLHCPTCVTTIREAIQELSPSDISWVSPNVVTSVVTVEHTPAVSIGAMKDAIEEKGFEVVFTSAGDGSEIGHDEPHVVSAADAGAAGGQDVPRPGSAAGALGGLSRWMSHCTSRNRSQVTQSQQRQAHLQNCEQCRSGSGPGHDGTLEKPSVVTATTKLMPQPSSSTQLSKEAGSIGQNAAKVSSKSFVTVESDDAPSSLWRVSLAVGGMTCAACANTIIEELNKREWISKVAVNLVTNSATVEIVDEGKTDELVEAIEDLGYDATLDSVVNLAPETKKTAQQADMWRATLAIGGMTCASCANTITDELKKRDWISSVVVNLVTNSATVDFRDKSNADQLVEAIEDLGYDATIDTTVSLAEDSAQGQERTVEILIEGLYCDHCPERVTKSLAGFQRQLEVLQQPTRQRPMLKLTYTPAAPDFTIRQILAAIEASDPAFKASIYHPPTLEERSKQIQRSHQKKILYRVIFTGIVCIPTFVIGIVHMSLISDSNIDRMYLMEPWTSGISRAQMSLFIMATPIYFFAADIFHVRAFKEIRSLWRRGSRTPIIQRFYRFGSMNTLMSLGTTIAYISSISQMIAAAVYQLAEINDSNFYFDSVVFLTFFLLVGRLIESYSKSRTGDAVEMLGKLRPTSATLVTAAGTEKETDSVVQADQLDYGDIVRVKHGASPPADGTVLSTSGDASFDESSLTGESRPVKKAAGDEVFAGTVNKGAPILVRITGVAGRSMLDQIVAVVREGQTRRAPMEQIADLLTTYFVPIVTLVAVLTWLMWMILGFAGRIPAHYLDVTSGGWVAFSLQFAIAVFVVACPCGLALAAPTAIFVGGGMAAKLGILAKGGGEAFEKASRVDCIVFDKTGTLTEGGEPSITDSAIYPDSAEGTVAEQQKDDVLAALRAVEESSSHPIAKAIVSFCAEQTSRKTQATDIAELPGKGMRASFGGEAPFELLIGNEALMRDFDITISSTAETMLQRWKTEAKSVAIAATRPTISDAAASQQPWTVAVLLAIADPVRPEARAVIRALHARGTAVWMLSGDNATTAVAVAAQVGIPAEQVIAGVLPTEKAAKISYLQATVPPSSSRRKRATVAMVGDGINDSPALATADVGVAIGSGSDVAISSAAFVLVSADLRGAVALLDLSRAVFRRVKLNFAWALVYNLLAVPVAAGALYPIVAANGSHVRLDPVWASLAMALSSISVVLSSLALRSGWPVLGFRPSKVE